MSILKELWTFLKIRKKFWLFPVILVMLFLGALIVLGQGSAVAPFIYTIFQREFNEVKQIWGKAPRFALLKPKSANHKVRLESIFIAKLHGEWLMNSF